MSSEMIKLKNKLEDVNIPFVAEYDDFYRLHIMYPNNWNNSCRCSVICHEYSYGFEEGLLEIMGLLTEEEKESDDVVGWLTADNVFERIQKDYKEFLKGLN